MTRGLGVLGALVAAGTLGVLSGGELQPPLEALAGEPHIVEGVLVLGAGDLVGVGQGSTLEATASIDGGGLDLVIGDVGGRHAVGHVGSVSGLFDDRLTPLGQEPPHPWLAGAEAHTYRLDCQPPLRLEADTTPLGTAEPVAGCDAQPLAVGSGGTARVEALVVDGVAVPLAQSVVSVVAALGGAVVLLLIGALLGFGGQVVLFASPAALLAPQLGLAPLAVFMLIVGASFVQQAVQACGWRRAVAVVLALASVPAAGLALQLDLDGPGEGAWSADRPMTALISLDVVARKVEIAERRARLLLKARDGRPLLVALGSSSTGGDGRGAYWPRAVQAALPEIQVMNLAEGGATSWHMRELMERLDLRPEVCVIYLGHNDSMPGFPGITIRGLEEGADAGDGWVAPVPLEDARDNVAAIAEQCGSTLVMAEYVRGQEPLMSAYAAVMTTLDGVTVADAAGMLAALPTRFTMIDSVHPTEQGHRALGRFVAEQIEAMLEQR